MPRLTYGVVVTQIVTEIVDGVTLYYLLIRAEGGRLFKVALTEVW